MLARIRAARQAVGSAPERVKLTKMFANGSLVGARFRVLQNVGADLGAAAVARALELQSGQERWLVQVDVTASESQVSLALEQQARFAVGVPGLARPLASGVDAGTAFVVFAAPPGGSVAEARAEPWPAARVAGLASRIAEALAPLHDQGIAYGCLRPELVGEGAGGEVLFGFGVAALATSFGAPGEASQLLAPEYRAPELRAALLPPTPASDVFALGTLLRQLMVPPDRELEACLARAQALDPRQRPREVRAFAAEFARLALRMPDLEVAPPHVVLEPTPMSEGPGPPPALTARAPAIVRPMYVPPPFVVPPPPSRSSLLAVWLLVGAGLVLMVGGVVYASFYAARRAAVLVRTASGPALHGPVIPKLGIAPPAAAVVAPTPEASTGAEAETPPNRPPRSHPPLVAPGVGSASFPEEAGAVMPILGSEPIWGTRAAPLTWVLFGDLDCPYTRRAWRALEAVKLSFGDDLRIVFRHRPLREHPNAFAAASVLAGLQRRRGPLAFFTVLHRISRDEASLTAEHLQEVLVASGYADLKPAELATQGASAVLADLQLAGQFAVKSTPFSFLNGQPIDGERSPAELESLLLEERRSASFSLAAGVTARALYGARASTNLIGVGELADTRACVPVGGSPSRGPSDALLTVVEFSDFECPFCKRAEPTLHALLERYPKDLRLVWKDFPLAQHKSARLLANLAADAYARGSNTAFWGLHDALFTLSETPDDGALGELASKAGLDGALLLNSARAGAHDPKIQVDMALAQKLSVKGTPTFFVNGRRVQGVLPPDQFEALIRAELAFARRIVARGVARQDVYALTCD